MHFSLQRKVQLDPHFIRVLSFCCVKKKKNYEFLMMTYVNNNLLF